MKKTRKPEKLARRGRSKAEVKDLLTAAFRKEFPHDTVDVSDGYDENVHVLVVSRRFDRMSEQEKRDLLWDVIDRAGLDQDEAASISLLLPVSPAEIK